MLQLCHLVFFLFHLHRDTVWNTLSHVTVLYRNQESKVEGKHKHINMGEKANDKQFIYCFGFNDGLKRHSLGNNSS